MGGQWGIAASSSSRWALIRDMRVVDKISEHFIFAANLYLSAVWVGTCSV